MFSLLISFEFCREEDANRAKRELEEAQQETMDPDEAAMRIQKNYSMVKAKKKAEKNRDALAVFIGMRPKPTNPEAKAIREVCMSCVHKVGKG